MIGISSLEEFVDPVLGRWGFDAKILCISKYECRQNADNSGDVDSYIRVNIKTVIDNGVNSPKPSTVSSSHLRLLYKRHLSQVPARSKEYDSHVHPAPQPPSPCPDRNES